VKLSLSTKIALLVFGLIAATGGLTAYLVYRSSTNALQTSISSNQAYQARQTMDKIDRFLYERQSSLESVADRQQIQNFLSLPPTQRSPVTATTLARQMDEFRISSGSWSNLTIVDAQGSLPLPTGQQSLQTALAAQPSVLKVYAAAAAGQGGYSDALAVIPGQAPVMLFMVPVRDDQARDQPIIGVLVGELAWQSTLDILKDPNGTQATLINDKGLSLGENTSNTQNEVLSKNYGGTTAFQTAQKQTSGSGVLPGLDNPKVNFLTSYVKESGYLDYHGNGWTLILETPKSVAFAPAKTLAKTILITIGGVLVLSTIAFLLILRTLILKPIVDLKEVTGRLSKGDFSLRTTIKSGDELGSLGQDFNDMADKMQLANVSLKQNAEESFNQKRVMETILDSLPVGVMVVDAPDGKQIMMNKVGAQITGRGLVEGTDKNLYAKSYDIIKEDGDPYPEDELPLPTTLRTGKAAFRDDLIFRRPDGTLVPVRAMDAPIRGSNGQITSAVTVFEDISKERELEHSRDEFFSIASHELRTPLTAIMGNSSLIQQYYGDKLPDDDAREMVGDIHESALRLIGIVNDFLDTSRLEQKHMKFEFQPVDVVATAETVIKEYQVTGSRKKIQIEVKPPQTLLPMVWADSNRTKQVLINLVGNALKFTEQGSITVSFAVEAGFVKVLITDTGRGMTPEAQNLLFKKFEQTGATVLTRDSVRGAGLGLYISKMIVEQMRGRIKLETSSAGVGTTFSFCLPIADPMDHPEDKSSNTVPSTGGS